MKSKLIYNLTIILEEIFGFVAVINLLFSALVAVKIVLLLRDYAIFYAFEAVNKVEYIYNLPNWPDFYWSEKELITLLAIVRNRQGKRLGHMEALVPHQHSILGYDHPSCFDLESFILRN